MQRRRLILGVLALPAWRAAAGASAPVSFAPVLAGRRLFFPADHGAHPDFRTEWWYVAGWLRLPNGAPLGFQTTFFRVRTGVGEDSPSVSSMSVSPTSSASRWPWSMPSIGISASN